MRMDIHAVGHSTYDEHPWASSPQVVDELMDEILSVGGAMPCSHYIDHPLLVQVGRAFVEQHQWCIVALFESLRVATVVQGDGLNLMSQIIFPFRFCPFQCLPDILQSCYQSR